jgi:hypothetical protein
MENSTNVASANPLSKYFRQPAIYLKLPSNGQFWPEGAVELPVTGEIPVYPLTARDEVTLRTPDALMNGSGVTDVIHSCCPSIKDAWKMPSVDVDAVLIGIRIASYGHSMDLDTNCPKCNEENRHSVDLRTILAGLSCPDYSHKVETNNLKIKVKPQAFFGVNRQNSIGFEEQRLLEALEKADLTTEERGKQISESMGRLVKIGVDTVTDSTEYIELEDGTTVTNKEFIREFYNNSGSGVVRAVQEHLAEINKQTALAPQRVACSACSNQYEIPMEFDYANFFANGS